MRPRSRNPNRSAGMVGHLPDTFFEREQPRSPAHHLAEHDRRVVGVAHEVDVRAGVGPAEHDPLVMPDLAARRPALLGTPIDGMSDGKMVVSGRPSATTTSSSTSTGRCRRRATSATLRHEVASRRPASGDLDEVPLAAAREALPQPSSRAGTDLARTAGSATARRRSASGTRSPRASPAALEHPAAAEAHHVGERQRDDLGAVRGGVVGRRELLGEHGPARLPSRFQFSGTVGGERHLGHELDARAEISPTVGMNSRLVPAWSRTTPARARNSSGLRSTRRHRRAVTVGVAVAERRREPERARRQRLVEDPDHARRSGRRGGASGRRRRPSPPGASSSDPRGTRRSRRWTVDAVEPLAERPPVPCGPASSDASGMPSTRAIISLT